jgi:hypothetical protein
MRNWFYSLFSNAEEEDYNIVPVPTGTTRVMLYDVNEVPKNQAMTLAYELDKRDQSITFALGVDNVHSALRFVAVEEGKGR